MKFPNFLIVLTVAGIAFGAWMMIRTRKKAEALPLGFVKVYDFKTKSSKTIPKAELAPGMVQVQLQGTDEIVWVQASDLKEGGYQHPPFSEDVRDYLRQIQERLHEVYPQTLESWEDGFRRDLNAETEIATWLYLSKIYSELVSKKQLSFEEKRDAFRLLVGCLTGSRETVLEIAKPAVLDQQVAQELIDQYFGKRE